MWHTWDMDMDRIKTPSLVTTWITNQAHLTSGWRRIWWLTSPRTHQLSTVEWRRVMRVRKTNDPVLYEVGGEEEGVSLWRSVWAGRRDVGVSLQSQTNHNANHQSLHFSVNSFTSNQSERDPYNGFFPWSRPTARFSSNGIRKFC